MPSEIPNTKTTIYEAESQGDYAQGDSKYAMLT
jgi:hypothetical protein